MYMQCRFCITAGTELSLIAINNWNLFKHLLLKIITKMEVHLDVIRARSDYHGEPRIELHEFDDSNDIC